jgi:hypothetical protein
LFERKNPTLVFLANLKTALDAHGLNVVTSLSEQRKTIILIGHVGSSFWPHFTDWLRAHSTSFPHGFRADRVSSSGGSRPLSERISQPLDSWSKEVIGAVAADFGGKAIFPSDQPYQPFQQWAMAATGMRQSPLGILIHPVYGLWHAYRGAIVFDGVTLSQPAEKLSHPCDTCVEKPCLSACPVSAFCDGAYDVKSCRDHVKSDGQQACLTGGCLARRACPIGKSFEYVAEQMQFHMNAFVK